MTTKKIMVSVIILVGSILILAGLFFGHLLNVSCKNSAPSHGDGPEGPDYVVPPTPPSLCHLLGMVFTPIENLAQ